MIDLRSDTLTMPDAEMLKSILDAPLGDDGRLDVYGRGEDPTINKLEDISACLVGKEAALLCPSGTMGNQIAIYTCCDYGDKILVDSIQHLYKSEKTAFLKKYGNMQTVFYKFDDQVMPDVNDIENRLKENPDIKLLCIENTHNFTGGTCTNLQRLEEISYLAKKYHIHLHMDGARLFNAVTYLKTTAEELCKYVDSVMFCVSKGLGAPVGSLLCGSQDFIKKAKEVRKLLGGNLRQGGIIAAPAIYALENNILRLQEDHDNCAICADGLRNLKKLKLCTPIQTNILVIDLAGLQITPKEFCELAENRGLLIKPVLDTCVRLVFYKGITCVDAKKAAKIILEIDQEIN